jgi:ABC-type multidrug transport system ATPase subunit
VERSWPCESFGKLPGCRTDSSLGGSGSGKTTLLNAVAHRLGGLPVEAGEVAYFASNGDSDRVKLGRGEVKRRLGFVRQQDFLVECLTGRSFLLTSRRSQLTISTRNPHICKPPSSYPISRS